MKICYKINIPNFFLCSYLAVTYLSEFKVKPVSSAIVVATWTDKFREAVYKATQALVDRKSSIDAVEIACQTCEELQCGGTVGYGGSPDEAGETTLDAMIMDGTTMNIGAVGALKRIKNAIGVARKVLENTQHTLLVGSQATDFAKTMGFPEETLSTRESKNKWKTWRANSCQPNFWTNVKPNPKLTCGPYKPENFITRLAESNSYINDNNHDTIGVVAIDQDGNIAAGTSTNGANHKIPGRVGDSPIPGSGGYAEKGIGAAACTGDGDILMRFLPSLLAVEGLRNGLSPQESAQKVIQKIAKYYPEFSGAVIVVSQREEHSAACHGFDYFPYHYGKVNGNEFYIVDENITCSHGS